MDPLPVSFQATLPFFAAEQAERPQGGPPTLERQLVSFHDLRVAGIPEAFDENPESWNTVGIRLIKARVTTAMGSGDEAQMAHHFQTVARALRHEFNLNLLPSLFDATILYGIPNGGISDMDITQVGRVAVNILHETPSPGISMSPTALTAESVLRRRYGDELFNCLEAHHQKWEVVEVLHPQSSEIINYPFALCDPRTVDPAEDIAVERLQSGTGTVEKKYLKFSNQQRWFFVSKQKTFELLVRRVASQEQEFDPLLGATVPMAVPKASGDPNQLPESIAKMQFVLWWPQES